MQDLFNPDTRHTDHKIIVNLAQDKLENAYSRLWGRSHPMTDGDDDDDDDDDVDDDEAHTLMSSVDLSSIMLVLIIVSRVKTSLLLTIKATL